MAGAMHKMAVYLGLVEEDRQYDDGYDSFEEEYTGYEGQEGDQPGAAAGQANLLAGDPAGRCPDGCDDGAGRGPHSHHDLAPAHVQ
jgi:hypothetical protein